MTSDSRAELADGWEFRSLRDVAEVNPRKPNFNGEEGARPVFFVPMAAVDEEDGTIAAPETRRLDEVRPKSFRTFAANDVLFAKITPCMENGKAAVVPSAAGNLGFGSTEFHVIRSSDELLPEYIWRWVRQRSFRREAEANMSGSVGQARVPADFLRDTLVPVPDVETQQAVVDLLARLDANSGAVEGHLVKARKAFDRARAAALTAGCIGALTVEWRDEHAPVDVVDPPPLSKAALKHEGGAVNTHDLVELPPCWRAWPIESITDEVVDYRGRTPPTDPGADIPHLRTTNISGGKIHWNVDRWVTKDTYDRFMTRGIPRRGDVLFTMEAPMGHVGVVDRDDKFSIAQRILLLRPSELIRSEYLALALQSPVVRRAIELRGTGSNVSGIAYKRFRSVTIPVPSLDEQDEIVSRVHDVLQKAEKASVAIETAEARAERVQTAVIAKAFRGELTPS